MNNGFAFYKNYWESIEALPIDQQKEVCYAICYYGITGEMVNPASFPFGYAMAQGFKPAIDNSVDRWNNNIQKAEVKHNSVADRDEKIAELILQGLNSVQIGKELDMNPSTVRKTRPWQFRYDILNGGTGDGRVNLGDFAAEKCPNLSENSREISRENSREKCENSREIPVNF